MGRLMCLVTNDHHELLQPHLQDTLPDVLTAAADHFHAAQADVLLDRATMAHLHMQESCCRELLVLLLC